jgi:hypothetical protein
MRRGVTLVEVVTVVGVLVVLAGLIVGYVGRGARGAMAKGRGLVAQLEAGVSAVDREEVGGGGTSDVSNDGLLRGGLRDAAPVAVESGR